MSRNLSNFDWKAFSHLSSKVLIDSTQLQELFGYIMCWVAWFTCIIVTISIQHIIINIILCIGSPCYMFEAVLEDCLSGMDFLLVIGVVLVFSCSPLEMRSTVLRLCGGVSVLPLFFFSFTSELKQLLQSTSWPTGVWVQRRRTNLSHALYFFNG